MQEPTPQFENFVRGTQVLAFALIAGVLTFLVVAIGIVHVVMAAPAPSGTLFSLIVTGITLAQLVPFFLIPSFVTAENPQVRQFASSAEVDGVTEHHAVYRTQMLIRFALVEGACFLHTVAFLVEHNWWSLTIVAGLVFVMLAMFPTRTRIEHYVESQQTQFGT